MTEPNILSSLVELTRQREQSAIRSKLLTVLIETSDVAWLLLLSMDVEEFSEICILDRMPNRKAQKSAQHYPRAILEQQDAFVQCAKTATPVWVETLPDFKAIIFPLAAEEHQEFLVVFDETISGQTERVVQSILDLYSNFLKLVLETTQDPLTRLLNRGAFDYDLPANLIQMNQHPGTSLGEASAGLSGFLVMLDLDNFKRINDQFGHLYGDEVLLTFSSILREALHEHGKMYRYGGEEFTAIIPRMGLQTLQTVLENLRKAVAEHDFPQVGQVTVSIGVAELQRNSLPSTLIDLADKALYLSKENGRNRVTFYADYAHDAPQHTQEQADIFF